MKIRITEGERYPDYDFGDASVHLNGVEAEIDPAKIEEWREIEDKYIDMQNELERLYKANQRTVR